MEELRVILIIIAAVAAIFVGLAIVIPHLVKKGVDLAGILSTSETVIEMVDGVTNTLEHLFPDVEAFEIIGSIVDWAREGAQAAEQLYKTSQIAAGERKAEATKLVYACIEAAGVELTDDLKRIADGMIEAAVFALPKTHEAAGAA